MVSRGMKSSNLLTPLDESIKVTKTYRYQCGSDQYGAIYVGDIFLSTCVATAATTLQSVYRAFRLKCIDICLLGGSTDVDVGIVSVNWIPAPNGNSGPFGGPGQYLEAVGSPIHPAQLHAVPPKGSLASMWFSKEGPMTNQVLFGLGVGLGAYVDITCEFVLNSDDTACLGLTGLSGLVTGGWYACSLDHYATTKTIIPISYPQASGQKIRHGRHALLIQAPVEDEEKEMVVIPQLLPAVLSKRAAIASTPRK